MDEDTKKAVELLNGSIQLLATLIDGQTKRLDAVQDFTVTISAFVRMVERQLADHLGALAAAAAAEPATKPAKRGPEVG